MIPNEKARRQFLAAGSMQSASAESVDYHSKPMANRASRAPWKPLAFR